MGLPEARLNLAQATIYLARAPKSNSVVTAIGAATEDARRRPSPSPRTCATPPTPARGVSATARGTCYPHDEPGHHAEQAYRPPAFEGRRYYVPSGMGEDTEDWTPGAGPDRPPGRDRVGYGSTTTHPEEPMIADAGDTALIVLAAFWAVLVLVLCVVLIGTYNVLTSTKLTIDAMREETVPLLREVKTSVEKTNREIDRVDTMLESAGSIVGRVERLSGPGRGGRVQPAREAHLARGRAAEGLPEGDGEDARRAERCAGSSGSPSVWPRAP